MYHIWEDPAAQHENRLPARAHFSVYETAEKALQMDAGASAHIMSLDGEWDFALAPSPLQTPVGFTQSDFQPGPDWSRIRVPGCWQMQGYGAPVYSASPYLFTTDPPFVPNDNETGCYRRAFTLPENMRDMRVVARFEGIGSMGVIYMNGVEVGFTKGSHMAAEFDVTDYIQPGENLLAVKVQRFCDGSYLEIQDMLHMSGIFRSVSLIARPRTGWIRDIRITADRFGLIKGEVDVEGDMPVQAMLYDGETVVGAACGASFEISLNDARLWSAEDPYLYTLLLQCNGQFSPVRVGFRTVESRDGRVLVNGKAIKVKGVNRHDSDTDLGWAVSRRTLEEDIRIMKRHNINFVRTSHYPSHPALYELCDEYGLYVMSEADIECHGMGISNIQQLTKDPAWEHAYVDRAHRMVMELRNHACVIVWSMGNESSFGENFRAVSREMKRLDSRMVHYAGAKDLPPVIFEELEKDPAKMYQMMEARRKTPDDPCVDIESTMYTPHKRLEEIGQGTDPRPFIVCEYAHSMGNSPGSLKEYWDIIYKYPRLLGACVWEWQDHGVRRYTENGEMYFAGGDELSMPYKKDGINGNFCNDGLLSPDKKPHPGMTELKWALQPVVCDLASESPLAVRITSRYQFVTGQLRGAFALRKDDRTLFAGEVDIDDLAPGESHVYPIDARIPTGESFLDLTFTLKRATRWAEAGYTVASEQFTIGKAVAPAAPETQLPLHDESDGLRLTVKGTDFALDFDMLHGQLDRWTHGGLDQLAMPLKQNFWRAPTDNDIGIVGPSRPGSANIWKDNGLDRLVARLLDEPSLERADGLVKITFRQRWGANPFPPVLDTVTTYAVYGDGTLDVSICYRQLESPYIKETFWWPRLGVTLGLDAKCGYVDWHGRGPGENYADRNCGSPVGWYSSEVRAMHTSYSRMQENGARTDTRWTHICDKRGNGLLATALSDPFTFTAHTYTDRALTAAWHEYQLENAGCTVVDIDMAQSGIGSSSCGPEVLDAYKPCLNGAQKEFRFRLRMK